MTERKTIGKRKRDRDSKLFMSYWHTRVHTHPHPHPHTKGGMETPAGREEWSDKAIRETSAKSSSKIIFPCINSAQNFTKPYKH